MQCLVTGASGYLGRALVAALLADGIGVRAVVHRSQRPLPTQDTVRADLVSGLPAQALNEIDAVYHLAGLAHERSTPQAYRTLNVDATVRLAREAAEAGVRRFIFLSSVKASLAPDPAVDSSASAPNTSVDASLHPYAASKADAECALRELAATTSMDVVLLRPALVYGGEARGYLRLLERWVHARLPEPPAGGCRSMIARDDLVRLLLQLHDCEIASPLTLVATDGQRYSARRLHQALANALGKPALLPTPPRWLWRGACRAADLLLRAPAGASWQRLQGEEYHQASDLPALCSFRPALQFEDVVSPRANGS